MGWISLLSKNEDYEKTWVRNKKRQKKQWKKNIEQNVKNVNPLQLYWQKMVERLSFVQCVGIDIQTQRTLLNQIHKCMWYYKDKEFNDTPEEFQGFVYIITDINTGRKYIGKKNFWKPKILPKTKKRKRRVRTRTESDWRSYFGSSEEVKILVEERAEDFKREIIRLCKSKGEMTYFEMKEQFDRDVLFREDYYNEFIGGKIHSKHLKGISNV